jgi:hypothetical protein
VPFLVGLIFHANKSLGFAGVRWCLVLGTRSAIDLGMMNTQKEAPCIAKMNHQIESLRSGALGPRFAIGWILRDGGAYDVRECARTIAAFARDAYADQLSAASS